MSRIATTFATLATAGRGAFMPFFCAGDPDTAFATDAILAAQVAGADIIELGVPFSDPIADGPVIQAAYFRALENGFKVADAFETVRSARARGLTIPVVAMASITLVEKMGATAFVSRSADAGFDAVLTPDLPVDRWNGLDAIIRDAGLDAIAMLAPASSKERRQLAIENGSGFIYQMAVAGVTGARQTVAAELESRVRSLRAMTSLPVVAGFGISTPDHIRDVCRYADGAIVGSALVGQLADDQRSGLPKADMIARLSDAVRAFAAATVRAETANA